MKAVIMPKLGLTMEEGTVVRWLKSTGDEVKTGEVLVEVETDKAVLEDGWALYDAFTDELQKLVSLVPEPVVEQEATA